jgi:hypothetical protein
MEPPFHTDGLTQDNAPEQGNPPTTPRKALAMDRSQWNVNRDEYRRLYLETWSNSNALDQGFADPALVDTITAIALNGASPRQQVLLARNAVHDHLCPFTTWRCDQHDAGTLSRHRKMYRGQGLRMLTTIEQLTAIPKEGKK